MKQLMLIEREPVRSPRNAHFRTPLRGVPMRSLSLRCCQVQYCGSSHRGVRLCLSLAGSLILSIILCGFSFQMQAEGPLERQPGGLDGGRGAGGPTQPRPKADGMLHPGNAQIVLSPASASVVTSGTLSFVATTQGQMFGNLVWSVNGVPGGNSSLGTITSSGVYRAPGTPLPSSGIVITAASWMNPFVNGSAQVSVVAAPTPTQASVYGESVGLDVLSNLPLAQGDVDYRFRASRNGFVRSVLWFDVYKKGGSSPNCTGSACECDGYGCGTGGAIELCIYSDDNTAAHLPTDALTQRGTTLERAALACTTVVNPRAGSFLRTDTFATPPWLEAGELYHIHWHNAEADARTIMCRWTMRAYGTRPRRGSRAAPMWILR